MSNWLRKSVLACGSISAFAHACAAAPSAPALTPAIALLDPADAPGWQAWAKPHNWQVIVPAPLAADANIDARVQALAAAVETAIRNAAADPARVYVAGRGGSAAAVFYAISRVPDLWAAGVAVQGSPQPAIDSGQLFTANFTNAPVLWISGAPGDEAAAGKLQSAGMNLEWRSSIGIKNDAIFEWLAAHTHDPFPASVDCETNSPVFARCYWIQPSKFDVHERNDVLPSTHLQPATSATLGFGYSPTDAGPGVLVAALPPKYGGPFKVGDRVMELGGKPLENAARLTEILKSTAEERNVAAMVERGKQRLRVETRFVLPARPSAASARVQGRYDPEQKQIIIISRAIAEMRVTVPPEWMPGSLVWNGLTLEKIAAPGCILLTVNQELLHASACP